MIFQEDAKTMNGLGRFADALLARGAHRSSGAGAQHDDGSLKRHMRALAMQLRTSGTTRLGVGAGLAREIRRLGGEAGDVLLRSVGATPVLDRLYRDARIMESCAAQARLEGGVRLPAARGEARILAVMREAVALGDTRITPERLEMALAAFDDVQLLTMAELWAAPTALRRALSEAFCLNARAILEHGRERCEAERFVAAQGRGACRASSPAFFERALQLSVEQELPQMRDLLDRRLAQLGQSGEKMIRLEHEAQALLSMRLDNLIGAKRMLDALDWQAAFARLSRTEAELNADPDGTYPSMDDASRAAVRKQVGQLAARLGVGELTVAKQAVLAAREHPGKTRASVTWWLYDDQGRKALCERLGVRAHLARMVPDPSGRALICAQVALTALLFGVYALIVRNLFLLSLGIPLAWNASIRLIGRCGARFVRVHPLLKRKIVALRPEERALVVIPALLSSKERAQELCAQLETLGCLERDENIAYLLLGDFRDGAEAHAPDDGEILKTARACVCEMNRRCGREKYFYLHRPRSFYAPDARWMGRERKRGALMDLNRLLLGRANAADAFGAEGAACERLCGRYNLVVTLDADTRMLPGSVHKLAGALLHPLNRPRIEDGVRRGYAVLQPNMELAASNCVNEFVRVFAGRGGMDCYPVAVSNLYQDVAGQGSFGGKGIYEVRAFMEAVEGRLRQGRILSHDLIEGELAGAGFVGDVSFYDGYPETFSGYLKRLNRWTRGDWQLLPMLFGRGLRALSRLKMLDNLLRSLVAPALFALLLQAIWLRERPAFALGVFFAFLTPIAHLFHARAQTWWRAIVQLAALPSIAAAQFDAVARTLFRLAVSKRHMLDWVTSADAAAGGTRVGTACRVGAILCIPGLLTASWALAALALGALFALAPGLLADMQAASAQPRGSLRVEQVGELTALARATWRFFETYVTAGENYLPPDNVQIDPPVGSARRTSPTNIGLYLISCLSARELGFIRDEEMLRRLGDTMTTVERLETWNGQLYNWYDIDTLQPLKPRYVSCVDGGNLAAALLTCAAAVEALDGALAQRMRFMAQNMNFVCLYNEKRKLFSIGMDVENNRVSASHYDLLASESRILSYVAMMLGQVGTEHWKKLSRPTVRLEKRQALISWSGTMFEYLMPEIFMRSCAGTLLSESNRAVVDLQMRLGAQRGRPWGVSESGYYAFDMYLNYQYRAFGLREVALGGGARSSVVAPYAAVLALSVAPDKVADNLLRMRQLGWTGECGLYEAADYAAAGRGEEPRMVKSYMAHHQGMVLAALANALAGEAISRRFSSIAEARALSLLLEERPFARVRLYRRRESAPSEAVRRPEERLFRFGRRENRLIDTHLLFGAGATAVLNARGTAMLARRGVLANRYSGDLLSHTGEISLSVRAGELERVEFAQSASARFAVGWAQYEGDVAGVETVLTVALSPEDATLFYSLSFHNRTAARKDMEVTQSFPVALCTAADLWAHPAFQGLFVTCRHLEEPDALLFARREGAPGATCPFALAAMACGADAVRWEADMAAFCDRDGRQNARLTLSQGETLHPCCALRARLSVEAGARREMHFAVALIEPGEQARWRQRNAGENAPERARRLASTQAQAMLGFAGVSVEEHHLLSRAAAFLLDGRLGARLHRSRGTAARESLWALGISGDDPVIVVCVGERAHLGVAREAVRAHDFYRTAGLQADLVLVNDYGNDYEQPVRDALKDMIASSHLRDLAGKPGGVHLFDGAQLEAGQRALLLRAAAMRFEGGAGFYSQLRALLGTLEFGGRALYRPMEAGAFRLGQVRRELFNGYGGFAADGYAIDLEENTPAAWSNVLAGEGFGALVTERGGGFLFGANSRGERLTPFQNDPLREGWGWMFYLADERRGLYARLLPGEAAFTPFRCTHALCFTRFESGAEGVKFDTTLYARPDADALGVTVRLQNAGARDVEFAVTGFVDWLMGVDARDAAFVRAWTEGDVCLCGGAAACLGYLAALDAPAEAGAERAAFLGHGGVMAPDGLFERRGGEGGWALKVKVALRPGEERALHFVIGRAADQDDALESVRRLRRRPDALEEARRAWEERMGLLRLRTPDEALNRTHAWLVKQVLDGRVRARAGLYQAGGAYGFRDQLQDMLALLPYEPERVRAHLLLSARRQFEAGDVMHWWHMPMTGVRTRIGDDRLFLPFVTSAYVRYTGDATVLDEVVPYLRNVEIPSSADDHYGVGEESPVRETLHKHCMRAFALSAAQTGEHGLALMGGGDWNDSMNRVGREGRGESVWLSQFLSATAEQYAQIAPDEGDRAFLNALSAQMNAAVEEFGWDGEWYLRATFDDGRLLGSASGASCRIDVLAQAWAALAGLDAQRVQSALDAAWERLVDPKHGLVKLLAPPFVPESGLDPGYIMAYPPGVRENGGQYTHAACWLALACAREGQAQRAHALLQMLNPVNHARTRAEVGRYRVEPYVIAADVYACAPHTGRGGWTWYTGAAGWYLNAVLAVLGFERRADRVRLNALMGDWEWVQVELRVGKSRYRLICRKQADHAALDGAALPDGWVHLVDDGGEHEAVFPPRPAGGGAFAPGEAQNDNIPNKFFR